MCMRHMCYICINKRQINELHSIYEFHVTCNKRYALMCQTLDVYKINNIITYECIHFILNTCTQHCILYACSLYEAYYHHMHCVLSLH